MARWQFRPPVERVRNGYRINLDAEEKQLLVRLLGELRGLLVGPDDHPALTRLFPTAYHLPQHAEQDEEFRRLMRDELVASRLAAIEHVEQALAGKPPLAEQQVLALAQALNAVRLVLGTMLDVSEEHDPDDVADDDPMVGEYHLYGFLSWLLEWTVRSLSGT